MGQEHAQRSSVDGEPLHAGDGEAEPRAEILERREREVALVFVVHLVEFRVVDRVDGVGELHDGDARGFEERGDARGEIALVFHVRHDVMGVHHVGMAAFGHDFFGFDFGEKHVPGFDAFLHRDRRDVGRGFHAEDAGAVRAVVLQQVSVVAGYVDDERVGVESALVDDPSREGFAVAQKGVGKRRPVVVLAEEFFAGDVLGQLQKRARRAAHERERVRLFLAPEFHFFEQGVGQGNRP